jgi:hypothetical protein
VVGPTDAALNGSGCCQPTEMARSTVPNGEPCMAWRPCLTRKDSKLPTSWHGHATGSASGAPLTSRNLMCECVCGTVVSLCDRMCDVLMLLSDHCERVRASACCIEVYAFAFLGLVKGGWMVWLAGCKASWLM